MRLVNVGETTAVARVRRRSPARQAWLCGTLEDDRESLPVVDGRPRSASPPDGSRWCGSAREAGYPRPRPVLRVRWSRLRT